MNFYKDLVKYKDNLALIVQDNITYTYGQLVEMVEAFALYIKSTEKKLIFILCNNNIEALVAYLAALRENQCIFLISHDIDDTFLHNLIEKYNPDYIWGNVELKDEVIHHSGDYKLFKLHNKRSIEIYKDLNLLLSTSGSTGSSKLVKLTGKNLNANAKSIAEYLGLSKDERPITVLPMNYSYGLSIINSHLLMGSTIVLTNYGVLQREFWNMVEQYKVTSLCGVPYTYEMYQKLRVTKMELPYVKTFTQAGGKLFPSIAKEFAEYAERTGKKFFIMYGQTEATARISYVPSEYGVRKPGSIGIAIPNGKIYLIDQEGNRIDQPNVNGEMVYQGENVMLGYATEESELATGDEKKGVLKTGDLGYFDEDGFFYITGRKNRNIKICGNRINLDEVEKVLQSMDYNCYVGGEDELLKVVLQDETKQDEIIKVIHKRIHVHPSQIKCMILETIPRNEYGKVSYAKMFK